MVHVAFRDPPRAGILVNLDSGRVLWDRNPTERLPIASLTKMMTALLVSERTAPHEHALITHAVVDFRGSGMGILPLGKKVGVRALLAGLLLPSGNDAAIALAQRVSGSVSAFVSLMNRHAAQLGLGCTHYTSPSGYYDAHNYSCAVDLAALARADLAQPRIAALTGSSTAIVPFPIHGGRLYLNNNNPLVNLGYPGITGLKTGFTDAAGLCLVETATRHGVRLAVVMLNSPNAAAQAAELLDRGFQGIYHQPAVPGPTIPVVTTAPAQSAPAQSGTTAQSGTSATHTPTTGPAAAATTPTQSTATEPTVTAIAPPGR